MPVSARSSESVPENCGLLRVESEVEIQDLLRIGRVESVRRREGLGLVLAQVQAAQDVRGIVIAGTASVAVQVAMPPLT